MKEPRRVTIFEGKISRPLLYVSVLGLISVATVVVLSFFIGQIDEFQKNVIWTILAFGVAGISVFLPGIINLRIPLVVQAGGALAIFALIFIQSPVGREIASAVIPTQSEDRTMRQFFRHLDSHDYGSLYDFLSPLARERIDPDTFREIFQNEHEILGDVVQRTLSGANTLQNPSGYPPGVYRLRTYRTQYENIDETIFENVVLISDQDAWLIYEYNVLPH